MIEALCVSLALTVVACMVYCYLCWDQVKYLRARLKARDMDNNRYADLLNNLNRKVWALQEENQLLKLELMRLDPTEPLKDFTLFNMNGTKPTP
jgi:hypothetical protein